MKRDHLKHLSKLAGFPLWAVLVFLLQPVLGVEPPPREEGQFSIYIAGKEIGREKFSIQSSSDSVTSSSTVSFRYPGNKRQTVTIETELTMDDRLVPRTYQLRTDVEGQKGAMKATFVPGQAAFEYLAAGSFRKSGLLVGNQYTILDTNVFHHFIFIARLFDFQSGQNLQSREVIIPQELDKGTLKIRDVGLEKISIKGKNRDLHHLKADSGTVQIDLWIDDQHMLYKIALTAKGIEVVRG
jgi:hypothetical protein